MLLGVRPLVFLARLLVVFALTYLFWENLAPAYTHLLGALTQATIRFTELFGTDATRAATTVLVRGNGIFYTHRLFPGARPPGIPADWVQANMVLLIPLMLATPAPSLRARLLRLGLALALALMLQVLGLVVTIKSTWASQLGSFSALHYGWLQRKLYQFLDAFFQSFDTQLFPFAIWAGIHFRQLLAPLRSIASGSAAEAATAASSRVPKPTTKAKRRREAKQHRS